MNFAAVALDDQIVVSAQARLKAEALLIERGGFVQVQRSEHRDTG